MSGSEEASSARRQRLLIALAIYAAVTVAVVAMAGQQRLLSHTDYNHYALLADCWLKGRLDLGGPPPAYTGYNDFAVYEGKVFVSFPPFPAVLLLPTVAWSGQVEQVRDGQFFIWLSGIAPAVLFLAFENLRRHRRNRLGRPTHIALALLFGLGTVYWFSAAQGTVWFAGHVVACGLCALYILFSLEGEHPLLAGVAFALLLATRPSMVFGLPFFAYEAYRQGRRRAAAGQATARDVFAAVDTANTLKTLALFALPVLLVGALLLWHNSSRFGDVTEFGHRYLAIRWRHRIDKWGLFSLHYLPKNLAVAFTSLPFWSKDKGWQISGHGLALWLTSPFLLWALWPRRITGLWRAAAVSAAAIALCVLCYQNTGWLQFGYRFSNDFSPFLFIMLVSGGQRLGRVFLTAGLLAVVVNGFGALTFGKSEYRRCYFSDPSQRTLFPPD